MNIFFDNGAVCVNITWTESTISNKHHILNCHSAQEAVAEVIVRVSKYHTSTNLADLFTKTMAAPKREGILDKFTYWEENWSMWFFYPIEGLPQSIDLLLLERTKLECYSAQLCNFTEGNKLIWQTQDENGIQVPRGTRIRDNRMIRPLWLNFKAAECLSAFIVTV